jgi:hypothetical protein
MLYVFDLMNLSRRSVNGGCIFWWAEGVVCSAVAWRVSAVGGAEGPLQA